MDLLQAFTKKAIENQAIEEMDRIYFENEVRAWVGVDEFPDIAATDVFSIVEAMVQIAQKQGRIEALSWTEEMFETKLYDLLTPAPSKVNQRFHEKYQQNPKVATDDFYQLSKGNNYIKTREIAKNIAFLKESQYGTLEITINLSKPEKDPKEIAKAKLMAQSDYPKCQLCMENEGYVGRINHPARSNHRIIRLNLGEEVWGLQYSPYAYYEEHCIFLNETHVAMTIEKNVFRKLLKIVELFPHYFVGSNADLPIVGGSILSHEHFQGGIATLPMAKARVRETFNIQAFPALHCEILEWPMSVIRLKGENIEELVEAATLIFEKWDNYSDESLDIVAKTDGTRNHTVTPIARKKGNCYELDLVLRDNHTTEEFPDGVFHPHQDVQHIKQENIGLIEVMGLAILPPRLKTELVEVENYLLDQSRQLNPVHQKWAEEILARQNVTEETVHKIVQEELGSKFERVLEDAGVFKNDAKGKSGFRRFLEEF